MEHKPAQLIYVSCNPATLARDSRAVTLKQSFKLESITPLDMFPQTAEIEVWLIFTRRRARSISSGNEIETRG